MFVIEPWAALSLVCRGRQAGELNAAALLNAIRVRPKTTLIAQRPPATTRRSRSCFIVEPSRYNDDKRFNLTWRSVCRSDADAWRFSRQAEC